MHCEVKQNARIKPTQWLLIDFKTFEKCLTTYFLHTFDRHEYRFDIA